MASSQPKNHGFSLSPSTWSEKQSLWTITSPCRSSWATLQSISSCSDSHRAHAASARDSYGLCQKISLCEVPHLLAAHDMPKQSPAHHAEKGDTMRKSILFVAIVIVHRDGRGLVDCHVRQVERCRP